MQALSANLRNQLERTVIAARDAAEVGAWAALERLAVNKAEARSHMTREQRDLRVKLRAKGRQLGDKRKKNNGEQDICYLHQECAYEYWHQMLFARFLAENQLLIHPDMQVPVTLSECEELAAEEGTDGWTLAARYASRMLPQIFRPDDPLLGVTYAPEDKQALEKLLARLPVEVFTAEDSLGWVYQFWQTKRKKEVNDSGEKIGADELPAVTQLFTEDYMVKFLLHNTLGAWWAGKKLTAEAAENAEGEEELREKVALPGVEWEYLRFVRAEADASNLKSEIRNLKCPWRPAAGTFPGWPKQAAELEIMDPCCGSGHFLVAAFDLMVRIRMEEEGLDAAEASDAVLRDNLFGLEIDPRCTQIAAFALAFAAWTFPDAGGYRPLPELHIACTGIAPQATEEQWIKLAEQSGVPMPAGGREPIRNGLINLHRLFSQAPTLGSLIDPNELPADLIAADYETIQPYVAAALTAEHADEQTHERAVAAAGMVKAASLLASEYTLVITNVPYLGRGKQDDVLKAHLQEHYPEGKSDLATTFVERCLESCAKNGTAALVTPQNWLFQGAAKAMRQRLLRTCRWDFAASLGSGGFQTPMWDFTIALLGITHEKPAVAHAMFVLDVSNANSPEGKAVALVNSGGADSVQRGQLANPDGRVTWVDMRNDLPLLNEYADSYQGLRTGDIERFTHMYWEQDHFGDSWVPLRRSTSPTTTHDGIKSVLLWEAGAGRLHENARIMRGQLHDMHESGNKAWGAQGVALNQINLGAAIYSGHKFDFTVCVVIPKRSEWFLPIWTYCCSSEYEEQLRALDQRLSITNQTLLKVPIDLAHWREVAAKKYPDGLPEPESDDPTQWLFHGRPEESTAPIKVDVPAPLHVAIARLLGYRWPTELDEKMRLSKRARAQVKQCDELLHFADIDGIVCIPAVAAERTAADRLQSLLSACGIKSAENLEDWLRDKFFVEHCQLFHQRPFIWHIWDGRRKDGFHALVNYHKLDRKLLEKLIYGHLGDWISRQKGAESRGESGAEARRLAAEDLQERLKVILEGKPPYDIFVRWKPLQEQPIGWDPDLNDGVRINIRPFVTAGVLRKNPRIKWKKDRGKEPARDQEQFPWFWEGGEFTGARVNDIHLTLAEKKAARENAKKK